MSSPQELESALWKALRSDMTMMLGLDAVEDGHARPMTANIENDKPPIWFFTSRDNDIYKLLTRGNRAIATFTSKDHQLFATLHGNITVDHDRSVVDRLWNPFIAAWYEGGKEDPQLVLLRFDAERAQIWENATTLFAGIKLLFGSDPKKDYKDKVARVDL